MSLENPQQPSPPEQQLHLTVSPNALKYALYAIAGLLAALLIFAVMIWRKPTGGQVEADNIRKQAEASTDSLNQVIAVRDSALDYMLTTFQDSLYKLQSYTELLEHQLVESKIGKKEIQAAYEKKKIAVKSEGAPQIIDDVKAILNQK